MRVRLATALLAAALLALAAAGCGGEDAEEEGAGADATREQPAEPGAGAGEGGASGRGEDGGGETGGAADGGRSAAFTPEAHDDSGGGAAQFRVPGGDNSIQTFGAEAEGAQFEQAARALHNFLDARAQGTWAAACRYLADSVRESLRGLAGQTESAAAGSCATLLRELTNPAAMGLLRREAKVADVGSLRAEDEQGFLIYRGLEGTILAIPMAREGGRWKVASLAGVPLN